MSRRSDDDFRAEVLAHLELEVDALIAEGMSPGRARAEARRRFGNVTRAQESFYEDVRWMPIDHLRRDLKIALRHIRRAPISALAILLSLTLGVGLNVALFSFADRAVLSPLPVADPDSLVNLRWEGTFVTSGNGTMGYGALLPFPLFEALRDETDRLEGLFAATRADVHARWGETSQALKVEMMTGGAFDTLGVSPALGRLLGPEDDRRGAAEAHVVLSHGLWTSQFGAGPDVLGRSVRINRQIYTVVGVAPAGFPGLDRAEPVDFWIPMGRKADVTWGWTGFDEHHTRFSHVYGRLAAGSTREDVASHLAPWFAEHLQRDTEAGTFPSVTDETLAAYLDARLEVEPGAHGQSRAVDQLRQPIQILGLAGFLVFLLACLNVGGLSVARAMATRRASSLQVALGAGRRRLVMATLVESALFATGGAALGLVVAPLMVEMGLRLVPGPGLGSGLGTMAEFSWGTAAVALALAFLVTAVAGTAPAVLAASTRPIDALRTRTDGGTAGVRARRLLIVFQFALALVLLFAAGLFSRTLLELRGRGAGFPESLIAVALSPGSDGFEGEQSKQLTDELIEALRREPAVEEVGAAAWALLTGGGWNNPVTVEVAGDRVVTDLSVPMNAVSSRFFDALGANVLRGRSFDLADRAEGWGLRSAIVNREFADRYLPGKQAVGARLAFGRAPDVVPSIEIVGVVETFQNFAMRDAEPQVFFSLMERPVGDLTLYVRPRGDSREAAEAIRRVLREVEPGLTLVALNSVGDQIDRLLLPETILATLSLIFAALAISLAMIGLYAVLAASAQRRRHEVGVRIALGASRRRAARLLVNEALTLGGYGVVLALPGCWVLGRLVETRLYAVSPVDPLAAVAAVLAIGFTCVVASLGPAREMARVDPLAALREE